MKKVLLENVFKFFFGINASSLNKNVIMTPYISWEKFKSECEIEKSFNGTFYSGFNGVKKDKKFTYINCGAGSGLAGDAVFLLGSSGAENVLFIGSCGAFGDGRIGDLLMAGSAFNGEGFSQYHGDAFDIDRVLATGEIIKADNAYSEKLSDFLRKKHKEIGSVREGNVFTIGSIMAETGANIDAIKKAGFSGIEMELSAFFKSARVKNLKTAALLVISDLPGVKELGTSYDEKEKRALKEGVRNLVSLAAGFIMEYTDYTAGV